MTKRGGLFYWKRTDKSDEDNKKDYDNRWSRDKNYPMYDPNTHYPGRTNPGWKPTHGFWTNRRLRMTDATLHDAVRHYNVKKHLYQTINQTIDKWDVSRVTNMSNLFEGMTAFDENLQNWDVSNVKTMHSMFKECKSFNNGDSIALAWNTKNLVDMTLMFSECENLTKPILLDTSKVVSMERTFQGCKNFNNGGTAFYWNTENVTNMKMMFYGCKNFNRNISDWNVKKVKNWFYMFGNCLILEEKHKPPRLTDTQTNLQSGTGRTLKLSPIPEGKGGTRKKRTKRRSKFLR